MKSGFGKKLFVGVMLLAISMLTLVGGFSAEHYLSKSTSRIDAVWEGPVSDGNRDVFYPRYLSENCEKTLAALDARTLKLDSTSPKGIGLNPEWDPGDNVSGYTHFNLHSLRFIVCHIKVGGEGDIVRLSQADTVLRHWLANNPLDAPASDWAWTEHATSWRAIVFSYFLLSAQRVNYLDANNTAMFISAIAEHVAFIRRPSVYRPDHNHGLNNALALLSLAVVENDPLLQRELLQLGFSRAEQQMADNVSVDGIHLEQSGFYHFYTLRSFLEILRVARNIGWPISDQYQSRLASMITTGLYMAGKDGEVDGMPYSMPGEVMTSLFDVNPDFIRNGRLLDVKNNVIDNSLHKRLGVFAEGGYSFFAAEQKDDIELVFHTRILDAPHAQRDALGITVRNGDGALIPFTSTMYTSENDPRWRKYFLGSVSHNGVMVEGMEQAPLNRRRDGILATISDSWKVNAMVESAGLADWFAGFRRRHQLDRRSLQERLVPSGGEVLNFGSEGIIDYVTARHTTYEGIEQRRTVVKIGTRLVLVWDRLRGDNARQYVQQFHFSPDNLVKLEGKMGTIEKNGEVIARAQQLMSVNARVCRGKEQPDPCGWYTNTTALPHAAPVLMYSAEGEQTEFLWVLQSGEEPLKVFRQDEGNDDVRRIQIDVNGSLYTVELMGQGVSAELASAL